MTDGIKLINLDTVDSTNRYLSQYRGEEGELMTVVTARFQTAGRGQGSHTWESEEDKNLMFSIKTRPHNLQIERQYVMMQAEALAIFHTMQTYADGFTIKWPNDIYWHDRKISGTLSESSISTKGVGSIILGTGININQEQFLSDAPNPVSLCNIINRETSTDEVLSKILDAFAIYIYKVYDGKYDDIHDEYMSHLYRRKGYHQFRDNGGTFTAAIDTVQPSGRIRLRRIDGTISEYDFREVKFII